MLGQGFADVEKANLHCYRAGCGAAGETPWENTQVVSSTGR